MSDEDLNLFRFAPGRPDFNSNGKVMPSA